jgi:hypothetical protein
LIVRVLISSISAAPWWGYTTVSPTLKTICCFPLSRPPDYHEAARIAISGSGICAGQSHSGGWGRNG